MRPEPLFIFIDQAQSNMNVQEKYRRQNKGAVLIFALWTLSFLAVMALNLGYNIRQKITFVKRIETRAQASHIAEGGVKVAVALLLNDLQKNEFQYTPAAKAFRHNNRTRFEDIRVGEGACEVGYMAPTDGRKLEKRFGVMDEEGKINVNTADKLVLKRIVGLALSLDEEYATKIADQDRGSDL
jgi:type II secretory pathway component PulK